MAVGIDQENTHHQQGEGPGENVTEGLFSRDSLGEAPFDGVGDGHAHGEEEHRENDVGEAHGVLERFRMFQEMRHSLHRPEVVHEYHQEHREPPEHVNGAVASTVEGICHLCKYTNIWTHGKEKVHRVGYLCPS